MAFMIKGAIGRNNGSASFNTGRMVVGPSHCPRCQAEISDERYVNGTAICVCGWVDPRASQIFHQARENQIIKMMIAAALVLGGIYAHLLSWGSHAGEIPLLKISQLTGTLSNDGYRQLAQACIDLNKWDCAKDTYSELFNEKHDVQALNDLASFEFRLGEPETALSTYKAYIAAGGKESEAYTQLGYLLERSGQVEEALKAYENGIANAGETLPIKATTGLVQLLIKQGKYDEALTRINAFHASAGNASGYLNTEQTQLEEYLSKQAKSTGSKSGSRKGA